MSFSLTQILLFIAAYLSGLFAVAHFAERGIIPQRITRHPAVYVLSLGVFAGALASNGTVELAYRYGYSFLQYYIGIVALFVMATLLLLPLLRLCRVYQLSSLADVLTFRFRSRWVGAVITIAMCITLLPLLALQIQAVADSIHILAGDTHYLTTNASHQDGLAFLFCLIIIVFSILFGTRQAVTQQRNIGLVTAIAFESLIKLASLFVLFFVAIYSVFDGFSGLELWLAQNPSISGLLDQPMRGDSARALLLIFFAGAVCMPHIFHMAFAEKPEIHDLRSAGWGLPLYMMLLSLPVLPVTWAGIKLGHDLPLDYTGLAIGLKLQSSSVSAAAFVAGLSAASATIIVTTLALANMCLRHLILPGQVLQIDDTQSIYTQFKWVRRALITVLILAGFAFFVVINNRESLIQLGLVAFIGTLQFLPGIAATFYWPNANHLGLLSGLAAGLTVWFFTMLLPIISSFEPSLLNYFSLPWLYEGGNIWVAATLVSITLNTSLFIVVSLISGTSSEERVAAEICSMDDLIRPIRQKLSLRSPGEFAQSLSTHLGQKTAQAEIVRALDELQFDTEEARPYALRRLRNRIEANLSGLLGPAVAHDIVNQSIPIQPSLHTGTEDINLIERNLDRAQLQFTGLAADLDNLRRHYRETLNNLPVGVCSMGADGELLMWNRSMEQITAIPAVTVLGSLLDSLPDPWRDIIGKFLEGDTNTVLKKEVSIRPGSSRWISLHKTSIEDSSNAGNDRVLLVEDITDYELLEEELLHSERLASIGRLAAGVAHEIGNPITGIACLAQNLEYETDTSEIRNMAHDILTQTDRVTRIVESLVNFSHVGSGGGDIQLTPSNLADCVDEAIHLLQLDHQAKAVKFTNHCNREMVVLADSQRLLQVFINLLGNARDACESGGEVQVMAHSKAELIIVDIEDNGCGIPPGAQTQIFEPFFTTKDPGEGTGLGLPLVYSIMEDMGGSIQVNSPTDNDLKSGTRVTLQLQPGSYGAEFELLKVSE
ncbi:MAG: PAS domain S-box protein [Halieaceae bacterium]|jgi:PAS domain S-box-containing protein|nr:PAS domain S-box protein [Halieaceae bacterium]